MLATDSCKALALSPYKFSEKSIIIGGMSLLAYGGYLGILVQARFFPNNSWPYMFETTPAKAALRILIIVVLLLPAGILFLVIPKTAPLFVSIVFKTNVPMLAMSICLFSLSNMLSVRFKLVNDNYSTSKPILPE